MTHKKSTYHLKRITSAIVLYELLFWLFFYVATFVLRYISEKPNETFQFLSPQFFWMFLLIPLFLGLFYKSLLQRNKVLQRYSSPELVSSFLPQATNKRYFLKYFLIRNALAFIVIAMMQPAFGVSKQEGKASGVELVFVVDISNSMNVRDMSRKSSRIQAAKRAMHQYINTAPVAKFGLLVFAGSVYPQLPLTADKSAVKMYIDNLETDLISNQGTAIGQALTRATDFFIRNDYKRVIVLITDGEDHEGGIDEAMNLLEEKAISLQILALGTEQGGLVPKDARNLSYGYLKDEAGKSVVSALNVNMVKQLAQSSNAPYLISDDAYPVISSLLTHLNTLEATNDVALEFEIKANYYHIPLLIGMLFLFVLFIWDGYKIVQGFFIRR